MLRAWIEECARTYALYQERKLTLAQLEADVEATRKQIEKEIRRCPWWWRFVGIDHMKRRS